MQDETDVDERLARFATAVAAVEELINKARYIEAYDLADKKIKELGEQDRLKYLSVLALARLEATEQASELYDRYELAAQGTEDALSLRARFKKDLALQKSGDDQSVALVEAAEAYLSVAYKTKGIFPAINAASLLLWAGQSIRAREIAQKIIDEMPRPSSVGSRDESDPNRPFWERVTLIEAYIIVGKHQSISALVPEALEIAGDHSGLISTAARSISRTARIMNIDTEWLSKFRARTVIHFCGHIIKDAGPFLPADEGRIRMRIREELDREDVGFGYGSLAAGADILFAEELLRRGAELTVVLPFKEDEFIRESVAPSGAGWVDRFKKCRDSAVVKPVMATEESYLGDSALFTHASRIAMGLAVHRAEQLSTKLKQIAVWDRGPAGGSAGTAIDVGYWAGSGRVPTIIEVPRVDAQAWSAARRPVTDPKRDTRAMLFGDVKNFSKMADEQLPRFVKHVLGAWANVIADHHDEILFSNTWGDAFYLVFKNAGDATACALDLQDAMSAVDLAGSNLPGDLALRIGGHLGPVYASHDLILGRTNYFGAQVSRAARMEPITPPGLVYVTEQFAASMILEHGHLFAADYAGIRPAAKGYGDMRMYRLRRKS